MLTADVRLSVRGIQQSALDLGVAALPFALDVDVPYVDGTTSGKADRVFTDTRTLAPSATEDLDLAAVLHDAFGAAITFATIKAVIIRAAAANTNNVNVTRPASNGAALFLAAGDGVAVRPGFAFAMFGNGAGVPVTPDTGDLLTVTNGAAGTSVSYDVVIIGTSA
jgi:hypothetical protein